MKTSVYLSNQSISAVVGMDSGKWIKIAGFYRMGIPNGLMHNAVILDHEGLAVQVGEFFSKYQLKRNQVSLVIDSDSLVNKIMDVPIVSDKQLRQMIPYEFAQHDEGQYLYDYAVVTPRSAKGDGRIFAISAERDVIQAYKALFDLNHIALRGIDVVQVCAMRFCNRFKEYRDNTFIFSLLEGSDMLSMLFSDNQCIFSNRVQLTEQRGTPAAAVEISRALSSMVQYNYAKTNTVALSDAYLSGLMGEEPGFYSDMMEALSIAVGPPPAIAAIDSSVFNQSQADYGDYLFCLGNLLN